MQQVNKERYTILNTTTNGFHNPEQLKAMIERSLDADKAEDIETIDLRGQSTIADYMIVASGRSTTQVTALAKKLQERLKARGMVHTSLEGTEHGNWVILDAGDVVVHLFRPEVRSFYKIEDMWHTPHHHAGGNKTRHTVQAAPQ